MYTDLLRGCLNHKIAVELPPMIQVQTKKMD